MKSWALDNFFFCICDLFCEHRPGKKMLQLAKQVATISVTFYMVLKYRCFDTFECSCRDDEVSRKTGERGGLTQVRVI